MTQDAVLHLLCGLPASGKSTLAHRLAEVPGTVILHEDEWLAALYGDQMVTVADYARCAARLRRAIGPHVVSLLQADVSVVLDFPANTPAFRAWMRELIDLSGARHRMHVLEASDDLCWQRMQSRNARGDHPFQVTRAQFDEIARHVSLPSADEGFTVIRHPATEA